MSMRERLESVMARIYAASSTQRPPRLVAISKFKPEAMIKELYDCGVRCFGENRIDELVAKASNLPKDIEWHFVGTLQTNKINSLLRVENLAILETVDSLDHAHSLEAALVRNYPGRILKVFLQVNTSRETNKHGLDPDQAVSSFETIKAQCPHLSIVGLMTIGDVQESLKDGEDLNKDFLLLRELRDTLEHVAGQPLELSMGMSSDFEQAIRMGSTNIRIGTTLFGERS